VRSKLVALSLGLVAVPGAVLGFLAASGATAALERAVGRQLATVAGNAAQELASLVGEERARLASWASQELMREVLVADVDKRVTRFLLGQRAHTPMLLDVAASDAAGKIVAATDPALLGAASESPVVRAAGAGGRGEVALAGPHHSPRYRRAVLELAAAIADPEDAATRVGVLHAVYDWRVTTAALGEVREDVAATGITIELVVLDAEGRLIGGSWTPRPGLGEGDDLRAAGWHAARADAPSYGVEPRAGALVGRASLAPPAPPWSVLAVQPRAQALAPVAAMNRRLLAALACVMLVGLAVAPLLAHRMARPLRALTRATAELTRVGSALQAVPVRSQDEIGELTAAFNRMAADLRAAHDDLVATARLASVGEIAAGIAHEVRTPLGILRGSAQMLGRTLPAGDPHQRELVDMIVGEVDRLDRVVGGLTELAKPRPPTVESAPLAPLLERAAEFVAGQAGAAAVAVRLERPAAPCVARCDPEQIYQVVLNLLVNALQAQPHGGEIRLRTLAGEDGRVGFEVSDDGPGIAPEVRAHVFAPFFTKREGGTGLGLALVERIVRAHGGTVTVASTPGRGATFRVELPAGDGP
jgi:signal transduction histidine kinase